MKCCVECENYINEKEGIEKYCEKCGKTFHKECFFYRKFIICDGCKFKEYKNYFCFICNKNNSELHLIKFQKKFKFIHLKCSLFFNEILLDFDINDEIKFKIIKKKIENKFVYKNINLNLNKKCSICNKKNNAKIKCNKNDCKKFFHIDCIIKNPENLIKKFDKIFVFCDKHKNLNENLQIKKDKLIFQYKKFLDDKNNNLIYSNLDSTNFTCDLNFDNNENYILSSIDSIQEIEYNNNNNNNFDNLIKEEENEKIKQNIFTNNSRKIVIKFVQNENNNYDFRTKLIQNEINDNFNYDLITIFNYKLLNEKIINNKIDIDYIKNMKKKYFNYFNFDINKLINVHFQSINFQELKEILNYKNENNNNLIINNNFIKKTFSKENFAQIFQFLKENKIILIKIIKNENENNKIDNYLFYKIKKNNKNLTLKFLGFIFLDEISYYNLNLENFVHYPKKNDQNYLNNCLKKSEEILNLIQQDSNKIKEKIINSNQLNNNNKNFIFSLNSINQIGYKELNNNIKNKTYFSNLINKFYNSINSNINYYLLFDILCSKNLSEINMEINYECEDFSYKKKFVKNYYKKYSECSICFDIYNESKEEIIYCIKCGVGVHQKCYGLDEDITKFVCDVCLSKNTNIICFLCKNNKGAIKEFKLNKKTFYLQRILYAHISCILISRFIKITNYIKINSLNITALPNKNLFKCESCSNKEGEFFKCKCCNKNYHFFCFYLDGGEINIEKKYDNFNNQINFIQLIPMLIKCKNCKEYENIAKQRGKKRKMLYINYENNNNEIDIFKNENGIEVDLNSINLLSYDDLQDYYNELES